LNVVCIKEQADWSDEGWNHPDDPSVLKREFGDFIGLLHVFDQVHTLHKWGLFRHPVADTWAEGNVTIMGDAAHPTLPFLAQGAIMAIEDAWVLAACFNRDGVGGLQAYQSIRMPRGLADIGGGKFKCMEISFGQSNCAQSGAYRVERRITHCVRMLGASV